MKKMKRLFKISIFKLVFLGMLMASAGSVSGQDKALPKPFRDTIFHKSGLVYHGRIIQYKKDEKVILRYPTYDRIVFPADEVESIGWSDHSWYKFIGKNMPIDSFAMVDVVYLKDGSVLRGQILEYQQGENIRFSMRSGEMLIQEEEIERIVQEPENPLFLGLIKRQKKDKVYDFREKGFYATAVFALLPGGGDQRSEIGLSVQSSFGHQFNRLFGAGIGISIDGYANGIGGDTFLPLFAEVRGYLFKKIGTPYWSLAGGYGFPLRLNTNTTNEQIRRFEGGYMLHPVIGYRFTADRSVNMTIDVGYKFQKALSEREFWFNGDFETRDVLYRRLSLRMSVIF